MRGRPIFRCCGIESQKRSGPIGPLGIFEPYVWKGGRKAGPVGGSFAVNIMNLKMLLAAAAMTVSTALSAAAMPETINITYVKSPFNLQNIVMKERGMLEKAFEKEGVKINWRVINSGAVQGQAMAAGALDFSAVMNTASLLMAAGAGNPIAVATGVAHPKEIFALVAKPGAPADVASLRGKTVVGPKGTVLHQLLIAALDKNGMKISDVNFVNMDPGAAMAAVVAGKADAGLLAANLIIKAEAAGAKTVVTCEGYVTPNLVMTVRRDFAKTYPEAYERVVAVNREALAWIKANKAEALRIGAKEQGITTADAERLYDWSGFYDTLTEADIEGMAADQAFLKENGLMEKTVDVRSLVLPGALR